MKLIKIITHPYILIASFCLVIISGEHLGGFYLLYLLLALPFGGLHALLGVAGMSLLVYTNLRKSVIKSNRLKALINTLGVCMLIGSLVSFFYLDKEGYNYGTFYQAVPLITIILFMLLAVSFLIYQGARLFDRSRSSTQVTFL